MENKTRDIKIGNTQVLICPPVNEDYWIFKVELFKDQAILGFYKFATIGIGFAQEEDWNTNLPYTCNAKEIYEHIRHNKKYKEITKKQCIKAIELIQIAYKKLLGVGE